MLGECTTSQLVVGSSVIEYGPFCYSPNVNFISKWSRLTLLVVVVKYSSAQHFIAKYSHEHLIVTGAGCFLLQLWHLLLFLFLMVSGWMWSSALDSASFRCSLELFWRATGTSTSIDNPDLLGNCSVNTLSLHGNYCYRLMEHGQKLTWAHASAMCRAERGDLAVVETISEIYNFFRSILLSGWVTPQQPRVYIGKQLNTIRFTSIS